MNSVPDSQKAYSMTDPLRISAGLRRRLNLFKSDLLVVYDNVFYPISWGYMKCHSIGEAYTREALWDHYCCRARRSGRQPGASQHPAEC